MDVGARLQTIRKLKGLSQRELAKRAGVTNSTISMIEKNSVSPSISSLKKVLGGIPMSLVEFFSLDLEQDSHTQVVYKADELIDISSGAVSMRLVVVPLIVLTLVLLLREPLGLTTVEMPTIVAIFCSPVAVTSAVMVQEIGGDEQLAQQVVAWSSVLSMGTIFCFAAALRAMGVM